jgi:hypothetical protein
MKSTLAWFCAALAVFCWANKSVAASAAEAKIEARLVWGTNDRTSPDPSHKPIDADLKKQLQELPLKWTNYFEVSRKSFDLPSATSKKVTLSDKCAVEVKSLPDNQVEVLLFGKGEQVVKRTQALPKGEILVLGGNAPNSTAWLVVLKKVE